MDRRVQGHIAISIAFNAKRRARALSVVAGKESCARLSQVAYARTVETARMTTDSGTPSTETANAAPLQRALGQSETVKEKIEEAAQELSWR